MLAEDLARLGVRHLALIDPDTFEEHSMAESALLCDGDVGKPKALALAQALRRMDGGLDIHEVVGSVTSPALSTLRRCNAIVTAPDSDGARLAAAMVASLYHAVLLDVGTGVRRVEGAHAIAAGADVRLIVPGDACLVCYGGLRSLAGAVQEITSPADVMPLAWHEQRSGSSRALNRQATGVAVALLQDLVVEGIARSTWIRIEAQPAPSMRRIEASRRPRACLCVRAGWGDAGGLDLER